MTAHRVCELHTCLLQLLLLHLHDAQEVKQLRGGHG
eukprot:CAMPEP_0184394646 /NCGR_PEP_ID=MMETSP0007-20130409/40332_1 /TAXON_ID=97485 /ORGANISM="Prymnesium parvum, Strain Texoma1" /LENGTH=35 /DNA_ID= /DNA_START= /DNA_END= /DNA_ORIENTATION=